VDDNIPSRLRDILGLTLSLLTNLAVVVWFSPIFALPGIVIAFIGAFAGKFYLKAQLSVKRELSNSRAPVLGHFGAAITGLGMCSNFRGTNR
jgi:hypothetical protein